ncbi:hypothetical protein AB4238_00520 [Shewanella sp. 10N.286.45.A1]|uniref:hypothetical protein n=1 Tax=Shewanella sp. 10N.286.45.A1 TaxID=3229694 RepID=UPI00354E24D1
MNFKESTFWNLYQIQVTKRHFLQKRAAAQRNSIIVLGALIWFILNNLEHANISILTMFLAFLSFGISIYFLGRFQFVKRTDETLTPASFFYEKIHESSESSESSESFEKSVYEALVICTDKNYKVNEERSNNIELSIKWLWIALILILLTGGVSMVQSLEGSKLKGDLSFEVRNNISPTSNGNGNGTGSDGATPPTGK